MTQAAADGARTKWARIILLVAVALAVAALVVFVLYARGGGPVPGWLSWLGPQEQSLLDASEGQEAVLRTLRLAGYDHAVVGEDAGAVVVRVEIPYVRTPADAELTWQTAVGAALAAFPDEDTYVAQLFTEGEPLVEVRVQGEALRDLLSLAETAELDEAWDLGTQLKALAEVVYLTGGSDG